ncbi:hypothetical protein ACIBTV_17185 [Micromonospora sp. NPDC049366]|uniref:hypothetical protein n=1 Tax=Micromonospora sp. NPDC049366 TaxID=3364271 RepID=UPI00379D9E44
MPDTPPAVPDFTHWPSFPFEGDLRVKQLDPPVAVEPPRKGEGSRECTACAAPDEAYIWVGERWRVRAMDRPTGLPMVLILESRSHLDIGDLPNLLAAELGVMTVRLERAIRSLDGVGRVHVNRWGDGSAHLHMWFLARPYGQLQLRGTFLSLWDSILPPIPEAQWRENLALVAAWLAEFGGRPLAEPPRIQWQAPSSLAAQGAATVDEGPVDEVVSVIEASEENPEAATGDGGGVGTTGVTVVGDAATAGAGPTAGGTEVVVRDEGGNGTGAEGGSGDGVRTAVEADDRGTAGSALGATVGVGRSGTGIGSGQNADDADSTDVEETGDEETRAAPVTVKGDGATGPN